jgi:hypothetical protein
MPHPGGLPVRAEDLATERVGHCRRSIAQRHVDGHQHGAGGVVQRAAQGIDQPLARGAGRTLLSALFSEHGIVGPRGTDDAEDDLLGLHISGRSEVPGALVDAGEPLAVQVAHQPRADPGRADRNLGVARDRVHVAHDAQNIQPQPQPAKRSGQSTSGPTSGQRRRNDLFRSSPVHLQVGGQSYGLRNFHVTGI